MEDREQQRGWASGGGASGAGTGGVRSGGGGGSGAQKGTGRELVREEEVGEADGDEAGGHPPAEADLLGIFGSGGDVGAPAVSALARESAVEKGGSEGLGRVVAQRGEYGTNYKDKDLMSEAL